MAVILYNERVATYKKMKQLDDQLDKNPTKSAVREMAELRIRNLQAFAELQSFNDTGNFLYKHPLIVHQSERAQLEELIRKDPAEFLHRYKNCTDSIRRYESYLKREDRKVRRAQDKEHLLRYRSKADIFKSLLEKQE